MRQPHGQNFLVDNNIANKIVSFAGITKDDFVIEVGPGKGILTDILKNLTDNLTIVDIDAKLAESLSAKYKDNKNITVINQDFLKFVLPSTPFKVVANLPYNVGTAIVQKILPCPNLISAVIMLQKDVITRLIGHLGSKDYGYISIFRHYYADAKFLFDVPPGCFNPKPKVMSSVVSFINKTPKEPNLKLFPFVKHCFSMRRKTILNGLSTYLKSEKTVAQDLLKKAEIDHMTRPDNLNLQQYIKLVNLL
ncbi:MAG: 16S rRNA (adenine(1518)-N(6)/adenine(1519)-N(6))-dimethyltransferase RsmA [Endomicrobiaceae bacterium]|nr:16S rRNA (adenine(1518)-N(6)/adenine(1519)-N(6))-dimethyltransferase RsmA [Endomicrobiaceae bacterium]